MNANDKSIDHQKQCVDYHNQGYGEKWREEERGEEGERDKEE